LKFVKRRLSILERLLYLKGAISWLAQTYIPNYNPDTKRWTIEHFDFRDRFGCFLSGLETAILGYDYQLVDLDDPN